MTHKQAVLKLLSDRKPHSHHELYGLGCVAHSRISDLRRDGWTIRQWREDGLYLYQLNGLLEEAAASVAAVRDGSSSTEASSSTPPNRTTQAEVRLSSSATPSDGTPIPTPDEGVLTLLFDENDQARLI